MTVSLSQLLEESFQIAGDYLERTGELGDAAAASRFLSDMIEIWISNYWQVRERGHFDFSKVEQPSGAKAQAIRNDADW
jgi:hypothetical protein